MLAALRASVVSGRQVIEPVLTAGGSLPSGSPASRRSTTSPTSSPARCTRRGERRRQVDADQGAHRVYTPDEGEISYLGETISLSSPRAAWDLGISTTFQEITLVPMMSVARNLYLGNEPRSRWRLLDVGEMNRKATALLRRYGIDIDVRRPVNSFGAGVQQMIAIVRRVDRRPRRDPRRADVVARAARWPRYSG